ncbi:YdaU family protein [Methylobacterium sp. E-005]|uniref:DUF1376 domain-containing protein n=1 Tax=Methylobacterium sp. E-005 TaxID=2836549 RepID=UPI001FBBCD5A|nr:DUF1376 domain-containing protein [Methylobacterium sp. E-005]MCJ2086519.1 YdaU family protein [Methylobacterium sp. E-005]
MKGEFYKMDFRAWNVGTVDLTLEQEGAYLRLCHAMYDVGGPVPNSTRFLQSIFRCGNTKATTLVSQLIAAGKIGVTTDGRLINHRVTEELAARERVSSVRRIAGERGGSAPRATAERLSSDPRATVERLPTDVRATGAKSLNNNDKDEAIAPLLRSRGEEIREEKKDAPHPLVRKHVWPNDYREQAWDRYGKKVDKQPSMAALDGLYRADKTSWTEFIGGVDRQAAAVEPQYRPSLERFIKRQKWTDQHPAREANSGTGSHDLFPQPAPSRGQRGGTSYDAVVTGMAGLAARRGLRPRSRQNGNGQDDPADHRSRPDDPEIEDAHWSPAGRYSAAHH